MRAALQALANDAETQVIGLIAKPPDAAVAACLVREAAQTGKPCVLALLGAKPWSIPAPTIHYATTLEDAANLAGALARGHPWSVGTAAEFPLGASVAAARAALPSGARMIRALYCGGTLAYEALWLLRQACGKVDSNLDGSLATTGAVGHAVLDLGAEEFTSGRPHPMIDPSVRRQQLLAIAQQPEVAVVLCDVVLGWGAHPDPAGALAEVWQEVQQHVQTAGRHLVGVASVCGTSYDPQGYDRQCQTLREHGFLLAESNAQAVRLATAVVSADRDRVPLRGSAEAALPAVSATEVLSAVDFPTHLPAIFATGPRVINLGLERFATQLIACGVPVVQVDWRPPAGGDVALLRVLESLH
jgi:FdrA protein